MTRHVLGLVLGTSLLLPVLASAQCLYAPGPQAEPYAANLVRLKYLATGPGFGDDRPELRKSTFFAPALGFNPQTTHSLHVTILKTSLVGPAMWTATIPPSGSLWQQNVLANGNVRWTFNDPAATYGVKKAQVVQYVGGLYVIRTLLGVNGNIANAPLAPAVDPVHVLVEIDDGAGNGVCYEGGTSACTGGGNAQTCRVP